MLTSATLQGGQVAVPDYGCKTPSSRLVLPPWLSNRPGEKGIMVWRFPMSATGYEFAGRARPEAKGSRLGSALHKASRLARRRLEHARGERGTFPGSGLIRDPTAARA
jgi:hypothetical protein